MEAKEIGGMGKGKEKRRKEKKREEEEKKRRNEGKMGGEREERGLWM